MKGGDAPAIVRHDQWRARRPSGRGTLARARAGRRIGGVALGIARFTDAPPAVVRALWAASVPVSLGFTVVGYLLLWALIPAEPPDEAPGGPGRS